MQLETMQRRAVRLYRSVQGQTRRLREDRLKLGRLLGRIRERYSVAGNRHHPAGTFCAWLEGAGIDVQTAYNWMNLAEGKVVGTPSRRRAEWWARFHARAKKAETAEAKVRLLREAVAFLIRTYDIPATATVRAK